VYAIAFQSLTIIHPIDRPLMSNILRSMDKETVAQIVALVRRISRARGRKHPEFGTVEVPLNLLNQVSTLASLYEGGTLPISQDLCQHCPLHASTVLIDQTHE
jgi:hypothetical protein